MRTTFPVQALTHLLDDITSIYLPWIWYRRYVFASYRTSGLNLSLAASGNGGQVVSSLFIVLML